MIHCYEFLHFPGYFETPLFRTFFHFPWDFKIAGFDCSSYGDLKMYVSELSISTKGEFPIRLGELDRFRFVEVQLANLHCLCCRHEH